MNFPVSEGDSTLNLGDAYNDLSACVNHYSDFYNARWGYPVIEQLPIATVGLGIVQKHGTWRNLQKTILKIFYDAIEYDGLVDNTLIDDVDSVYGLYSQANYTEGGWFRLRERANEILDAAGASSSKFEEDEMTEYNGAYQKSNYFQRIQDITDDFSPAAFSYTIPFWADPERTFYDGDGGSPVLRFAGHPITGDKAGQKIKKINQIWACCMVLAEIGYLKDGSGSGLVQSRGSNDNGCELSITEIGTPWSDNFSDTNEWLYYVVGGLRNYDFYIFADIWNGIYDIAGKGGIVMDFDTTILSDSSVDSGELFVLPTANDSETFHAFGLGFTKNRLANFQAMAGDESTFDCLSLITAQNPLTQGGLTCSNIGQGGDSFNLNGFVHGKFKPTEYQW